MADTEAEKRVLVYQMGKVGSKSVLQSLQDMNLGLAIYHLHFLNDLDAIEEQYRNSWLNSKVQMEHLAYCRRIREGIDNTQGSVHWYVVTLLRDPIARALSAFFYNLKHGDEGLPRQDASEQRQDWLEKLKLRFIDTIDVNDAPAWFDQQLKPVFGVDVLEQPFPVEAGYQIYRGERADILLLKLEHLNRCAPEAFNRFMGLKNFRLSSVNRAETSDYSDLYREFKGGLTLPAKLVRQVYSSPLVRRVYSRAEIEGFRRRWMSRGAWRFRFFLGG